MSPRNTRSLLASSAMALTLAITSPAIAIETPAQDSAVQVSLGKKPDVRAPFIRPKVGITHFANKDITDEAYLRLAVFYALERPSSALTARWMVRSNRPHLAEAFERAVLEAGGSFAESPEVAAAVLSAPAAKPRKPLSFGISQNAAFALGLGGSLLGLQALMAASEPDPVSRTPPPKPIDPAVPDEGNMLTREYYRSHGLAQIGAHEFYIDKAASGRGLLYALVDSGADLGHAELYHSARPDLSWNYTGNSSDLRDELSHGTFVAGLISGSKNDLGSHGVAYNAEFMALKIFGARGEAVRTENIADAFRRAEDAGAFAINNSWTFTKAPGKSFLVTDFASRQDVERQLSAGLVKAMTDAAAADMVLVFAAGNDGDREVSVSAGLPYWVPELSGHWVAVGAVDSNNRIADFSNRCGLAKDFCLMAPGKGVHSAMSKDDPNAKAEFGTKDGTSMAAPHVTGSLLLLKEAFPELTAPEIVNILFETATDLGEIGVDDVYGQGLLNIGNAMAPQGNLSFQMSNSVSDGKAAPVSGSMIALSSTLGSAIPAGLADARVMVTDKFDRGYQVELANFVSVTTEDEAERFDRKVEQFVMPASVVNLADGVQLRVAELGSPDAAFSLSMQSESLSSKIAWGGGSGLGLAFVEEDIRASVVDPGAFELSHMGLITQDGKGFMHSAEIGNGIRLKAGVMTGSSDETGFAPDARATASVVGLDLAIGEAGTIGLGFGSLQERGTVLGSASTGAFGSGKGTSRTDFVGIGGQLELTDGLDAMFSASLGMTDFAQDGILAGGSDLRSTSMSIGLSRSSIFADGDTLSFAISQPLRVRSGKMHFDLPVARAASEEGAESASVIRERYDAPVNSAGQEVDFQLGYNRFLDRNENARVSLGVIYRFSAGDQSVEEQAAALARFSMAF